MQSNYLDFARITFSSGSSDYGGLLQIKHYSECCTKLQLVITSTKPSTKRSEQNSFFAAMSLVNLSVVPTFGMPITKLKQYFMYFCKDD